MQTEIPWTSLFFTSIKERGGKAVFFKIQHLPVLKINKVALAKYLTFYATVQRTIYDKWKSSTSYNPAVCPRPTNIIQLST